MTKRRATPVRLLAALVGVAGCPGEVASGGVTEEGSGTAVGSSEGSSSGAASTGGPGSSSGDRSTGVADSTGGSSNTGDATGSESSGGPTVIVEEPIRIVYLADEATRGTDELWLRDEADYGAGPLRISHTLPAEAFISPFFPVSADGRWLIYRLVDPGPGAEHELWAVDVSVPAPEAPFRVDEAGELINEYAITDDASAAVWITASGVHTSSLTAASPGAVQTPTPAPSGGGSYGLFAVGGDSDTIAYTADPDGSGVTNAFVVSLSSGGATQRSDLDAPGTEVDGNSLELLPGGAGLVYQADRDVPEPELFWVALAGGAGPIKINDPITDEQIRTERVAPDGSAIAYWVGYPGDPDLGAVFVTPLDPAGPGAPVDVHASAAGSPQQGRIVWSPDASHLLYSVFFSDRLEGWIVDTTDGVPGTPQRITGDVLADGEHLVAHVFDPAGNVFYVAGTEAGDELFFVDLAGGAPAPPLKVSPTPLGPGLSGDLRFSHDGTQLLFTGFVDSSQIRDLYRVDLSGAPPWPVERIDTDLPAGGEVAQGPLFSANGRHVLYVALSPDFMERDLFDVPPGGRGFDIVLPISTGGFVTAFTALP